jgi:two-component system response regulator YesN
MYKIMLADDGRMETESLAASIGNEFGEACVVQCACSGRGVIELAEKFQPDIAVISVQLPGINGMEAMKEIRKINEKIHFIVVSAYESYDHAVEAIKLGALEYITKPFVRENMMNALRKCMCRIDREREKRSQELEVKEKLETVVPVIENGFIYNLLFYKQFHEDIDNYLMMLDLDISYGYMMAIVCGEEQQGSYMTNAVESSLWLHRHYKELRECVREYCGGIVGNVMSNKIAVLVACEESTIDHNRRIELINRMRELVRRLRQQTGIAFRIGIGGAGTVERMAESFNEAVSALAMTTGTVAHVDDLPIGCRYEKDYPIQLERSLFEYVEQGEIEHALSAAGAFFEWLENKSAGDLEEIRVKVLEFVLRAERIAYDHGGMTYQFHSRKGYLSELTGTDDVEKLKQWFLGKILESCQNVLGKREEKSNHIIVKAQIYIRENYRRDISLDDVSRNVNVSPYYFSKIFKEETGEGFVKYLTAIRIEKAKELLSSTEYSMREIGSMCGFSDPNYFSRSFKKNAGVTPSDYKASCG